MDTERHVHWSELFGNRYRFSPHPLMLTEQGYQVRTATKLKGESKLESFPVVVSFDRQYVIEYISRCLISTLRPQEYNDLQAIISDAYTYYNKQKEIQQ